ncbi:hypothetical protein HY449_00025 [Candidatus Pacearchaeota archaeon]|nr:hypothetical protein [Candidatus Pacearchaeota archaeon]
MKKQNLNFYSKSQKQTFKKQFLFTIRIRKEVINMALEGRCMKCKENREMKNLKLEKTKRGTFLARGTCAKCGTNMAKILSAEQAKQYQ